MRGLRIYKRKWSPKLEYKPDSLQCEGSGIYGNIKYKYIYTPSHMQVGNHCMYNNCTISCLTQLCIPINHIYYSRPILLCKYESHTSIYTGRQDQHMGLQPIYTTYSVLASVFITDACYYYVLRSSSS